MTNFNHKFIDLFTFFYICKQTFPSSEMRLAQKLKVIMMSNYRRIFYVKPNISADFEIYINVTLK